MIELKLDYMMADRKIKGTELAKAVGLTPINLSQLKTGRKKSIRFDLLDKLCEVLDCTPNDILYYSKDKK